MSEFDLLLCQPKFGPFQVASTLGDLAAAAISTVLVPSKQTQGLYILKEPICLAFMHLQWCPAILTYKV